VIVEPCVCGAFRGSSLPSLARPLGRPSLSRSLALAHREAEHALTTPSIAELAYDTPHPLSEAALALPLIMADATTGGDIEGALQKAVDRIAAQERLPTLQSDLVLLAIISIMLVRRLLDSADPRTPCGPDFRGPSAYVRPRRVTLQWKSRGIGPGSLETTPGSRSWPRGSPSWRPCFSPSVSRRRGSRRPTPSSAATASVRASSASGRPSSVSRGDDGARSEANVEGRDPSERADRSSSPLRARALSATLIEATVEGFFVWRLWTVTKKWWMRYISVFLWAFSFVAHCVWVGMAGAAGRSNIVDDANVSSLPPVLTPEC